MFLLFHKDYSFCCRAASAKFAHEIVIGPNRRQYETSIYEQVYVTVCVGSLSFYLHCIWIHLPMFLGAAYLSGLLSLNLFKLQWVEFYLFLKNYSFVVCKSTSGLREHHNICWMVGEECWIPQKKKKVYVTTSDNSDFNKLNGVLCWRPTDRWSLLEPILMSWKPSSKSCYKSKTGDGRRYKASYSKS